MKITLGRTVLYVLNEEDANQINRRRTTGQSISDRISVGSWPIGAQAHIGNTVQAGQIYPAVAVAVWDSGDDPAVNLKVQLDGTDDYWATSRHEDKDKAHDDLATPKHGTWHWPSRV